MFDSGGTKVPALGGAGNELVDDTGWEEWLSLLLLPPPPLKLLLPPPLL